MLSPFLFFGKIKDIAHMLQNKNKNKWKFLFFLILHESVCVSAVDQTSKCDDDFDEQHPVVFCSDCQSSNFDIFIHSLILTAAHYLYLI